MSAVAFIAAIGDTKAFPSGRTAAAWIGLTPRRYQSDEINM
ncbi:transposase [Roseinatronobacter thiooxidans]